MACLKAGLSQGAGGAPLPGILGKNAQNSTYGGEFIVRVVFFVRFVDVAWKVCWEWGLIGNWKQPALIPSWEQEKQRWNLGNSFRMY